MSLPLSFGTRILGAGALLLLGFLLVGWLLPGRWTAGAESVVEAEPADILPFLDGTAGWRAWTPWPDSGTVAEGPERGVGSRLAWSDRELGSGSFEISAVEGDSLVRYHVEVQDGAMRTDGWVLLRASAAGTTVRWQEEGDFGSNPLMGYWARLMQKAQSREMDKSLGRLEEVVGKSRADAR